MTTDSSSLVDLRGVAIASRHDPTLTLIAGIDWSVRQGEFWVVASAPGAGKSLLLEVVAGLMPPSQGTRSVHGAGAGADPMCATPAPRNGIGLVFADGGRPFNQLTVAQNVGLPLCYHRGCTLAVVAPQVRHLLEWTGLATHSQRLPLALNHGLRQRVALARALALQPSLLLLDSPLSGLAVAQVRWWLDFLARLHEPPLPDIVPPVAVAVTTDALRPWLALGTHFALIHDGRWQVLGTPAEVSHSQHPAVRDMLADPRYRDDFER